MPGSADPGGTHQIAGLAYYAHTNRIRVSAGGFYAGRNRKKAFKVTNYGIQLATNTPNIIIARSAPDPSPSSLPIASTEPMLLRKDTAQARSSRLQDRQPDRKPPASSISTGKTANQGGDYDQDVWGIINYTVSGSQISVTTTMASVSHGKPQGFGFIISGNDKDWPAFLLRIYNFQLHWTRRISPLLQTDSAPKISASGGRSCADQVGSTDRTRLWNNIKIAGRHQFVEDSLIRPPTDPGYNNPDKQVEWDLKKADGTPGSIAPGHVFLRQQPWQSRKALNTAFVAIVSSSSASAVATNSSSLQTGTKSIRHGSTRSTGPAELLSYSIDPTSLALTEIWNAASCMKTLRFQSSGLCTSSAAGSASRFIFTYKPDQPHRC